MHSTYQDCLCFLQACKRLRQYFPSVKRKSPSEQPPNFSDKLYWNNPSNCMPFFILKKFETILMGWPAFPCSSVLPFKKSGPVMEFDSVYIKISNQKYLLIPSRISSRTRTVWELCPWHRLTGSLWETLLSLLIPLRWKPDFFQKP